MSSFSVLLSSTLLNECCATVLAIFSSDLNFSIGTICDVWLRFCRRTCYYKELCISSFFIYCLRQACKSSGYIVACAIIRYYWRIFRVMRGPPLLLTSSTFELWSKNEVLLRFAFSDTSSVLTEWSMELFYGCYTELLATRNYSGFLTGVIF